MRYKEWESPALEEEEGWSGERVKQPAVVKMTRWLDHVNLKVGF